MTITVKQAAGPDPAFLYLSATDSVHPQCDTTRTIALAALADGSLTIAAEKAALIADTEQKVLNWLAAQAALQEL